MANEDWVKQLRDRLGDHEAPPPEDLWTGIERELARRHRQKRILRLRLWAAAAAVLAAVVIGAGYYLNRPGNAPTLASEADVSSIGTVDVSADATNSGISAAEKAASLLLSGRQSNAVPRQRATGTSLLALTDAPSSASNAFLSEPEETASENIENASISQYENGGSAEGFLSDRERTPSAAPKESFQVAKGSLPQSESSRSENCQKTGDDSKRYLAQSRRSVFDGARWTLGLHTANVFAAGNSSVDVLPVPVVAASAAPANADFVSVVPQRQRLYERTKHHLPIQIGLTAAYALSRRLSLTSGVAYTRAVSDFSMVNGGSEMTDRQTLRYIGVPLGLNLNVWQTRRFKAYVTAGGQADFNVSATVETDGVKADVAKDRVQWSVGAAAGAQYDIVPQVGLYAEPGVKYYFNNHSGTENVFKSRPCSFSLQVGVRLNIK